MSERFSLSIDSRLERLSEIAEFVEDAASRCGLGEKQIYDVQMAVDEACSNVIEHGYGGKPTGQIEIECEKRGKDFVIIVRDYGKPFDPKKVARPKTNAPLSERNIGGLGLFFIYKLMDRVDFNFSSGRGNVLTMVKKIKK
jgi:serine/threonine-protein kinase RsbW